MLQVYRIFGFKHFRNGTTIVGRSGDKSRVVLFWRGRTFEHRTMVTIIRDRKKCHELMTNIYIYTFYQVWWRVESLLIRGLESTLQQCQLNNSSVQCLFISRTTTACTTSTAELMLLRSKITKWTRSNRSIRTYHMLVIHVVPATGVVLTYIRSRVYNGIS